MKAPRSALGGHDDLIQVQIVSQVSHAWRPQQDMPHKEPFSRDAP